MLISDFLKFFQNASKWARVNVAEVESYGLTYNIVTTDIIDESNNVIAGLKEELESERQLNKNLEKEKEGFETQNNELNAKVDQLTERLNSVTDNKMGAYRDLIEQNERQAREIETYKGSLGEWRKNHLDLTAKIEKLQARKNKANITERDPKTGQLIAEYQGVKYTLQKL
jgi:chromosome segregation ATPase